MKELIFTTVAYRDLDSTHGIELFCSLIEKSLNCTAALMKLNLIKGSVSLMLFKLNSLLNWDSFKLMVSDSESWDF